MDDNGAADDNWLHAAVFPCPGCGEALFRVDLSPMADDYHFYCDQCANRVDISYYDDVALAIDRILADRGDTEPGWERGKVKRRMIEERLRPCSCGGRYRDDAPRRCPFCLMVAVADEPGGVDLWPGYMWWDEEDRDPTPEEEELASAYFAQHVRQRDIWRAGVSGSATQPDDEPPTKPS